MRKPVRTGLLFLLLMFAVAGTHAETPRSGYEYLTAETRTMQDDDFENPGMMSVEQGADLVCLRW